MRSIFQIIKEKRKKKLNENLFIDDSVQYIPSTKNQHVAVELCEQMIDTSREMESVRDEYRVVTSYLNDIQIIEDLPDETRRKLIDTATHINNLNHIRDELLETRNRISDSLFAQFQEEEEEIAHSIKRLETNETYITAIERDLHMLEGEKMSLNIDKKDALREMRQLKKVAFWLMILFATLIGIYCVFVFAFEMNATLPMFVAMFLVAGIGCFCVIRRQELQKMIRQYDVNLNHAITLENRVKIKYVNIRNAIDYACEKYHVKNSRELLYYYEQYQEAVKERKKFREANDDLTYYNDKLVRQLSELQLYDARVWINYPHAIIDKKEMVELKHNLIVRRQKLRKRIEYNVDTLNRMKDKALNNLDENSENRAQIESIIRRLDSMNQNAL